MSKGAINSTMCHSYSLHPDFDTYFAALDPFAWVLWSCGLVVLVTTCVFYVLTMRTALQHWKRCSVSLAGVLGVYPLVSAAAFIGIVVPRARLLSEAAAQEMYMIAVYNFFTMIIVECGGPDQLVKQASGGLLETRLLPCCCWPCCAIPRPQIKQSNIAMLRYLVLQLPLTQAFLYLIILVLWSNDMRLYLEYFSYFLPFMAVSIGTAVWGINMTARMAVQYAGLNLRKRYLVLQLVLPIVKLQAALAKVLPEKVDFACIMELNPWVFSNMIHNSLMMIEMLLLSILAWHTYRLPPAQPGENLEKSKHVTVSLLEDNLKPLEDATQTHQPAFKKDAKLYESETRV